jgi:hypothetical protein
MTLAFATLSLVGLLSTGCASTAPPFNTMKTSQVTAFRLQNFEPPPTAAAPAASPGAAVGLIPGLPPEIAAMASGALPALQGLLPPGLIPGLGAPTAAAAAAADTSPRFHNFRIIGQNQVMDESLREELGKILGDPDNFDSNAGNCMYSELGVSFAPSMGAPANDLLLSFSCRNIQAFNFAWPHPNRGIKPKTAEKLAGVIQKIFPY